MKKILIISFVLVISFVFYGMALADLNDGLVAYYPFNGNANDESGSGNNGVVYGAVLAVDRFGENNNSYEFDGIDDYINIGNQVKPSFPISVSVWVKINDLSTYGGILRNDQWNPTSYYHGF